MNEDIRLIERYAAGDEGAVEEIVAKYQRRVYAFIYRMTYDVEESKDLTQKTFINVLTGIKDFRKEASFKTWLYRIALNTGINHLRKNRPEESEIDESLACGRVGALSSLIEEEKKELVRSCLDGLPERQRLAVILRVYDDLNCSESARVMGCSEGAVKAHYHNGVKRLREILKGKGYEIKA
jgi:RNA polymerase sigma-70 factor (ECF subfamily)